MPRGRKKKEEVFDAEELIGSFMKGDRLTADERYQKSVDNIYRKLKPIWLQECKDAMWLLQDEYVKTVADIIYLDDQMGGNLDPTSLSEDKQNLLGWKQVQSVIEKYRAQDYSLVDADGIKAILSSIIKDKQARDADRLKAIEQYLSLYGGEEGPGTAAAPMRTDGILRLRHPPQGAEGDGRGCRSRRQDRRLPRGRPVRGRPALRGRLCPRKVRPAGVGSGENPLPTPWKGRFR